MADDRMADGRLSNFQVKMSYIIELLDTLKSIIDVPLPDSIPAIGHSVICHRFPYIPYL